jgi:hypothetical protein
MTGHAIIHSSYEVDRRKGAHGGFFNPHTKANKAHHGAHFGSTLDRAITD